MGISREDREYFAAERYGMMHDYFPAQAAYFARIEQVDSREVTALNDWLRQQTQQG